MKKLLLSMTLVLCLQTQLLAVPTYPYPIEMIQPDGSSLTIMQKGDEYYSWIETTDGYSIVKNANGIFEYAALSNDGNIIPSGVKVKNVAERTTIEIAFIASIPQSKLGQNSLFSKMK